MRNSFKDLSYRELLAKREELVKRYQELRFQKVVGHLDNPLEVRTIRRNIARLNFLIHNHREAYGRYDAEADGCGRFVKKPIRPGG